MKKEHERNSGKGRNIVLVVITVNATVSMLLIAAVIYSLTRITQQQQEITNLRNQLQRYEKTQPRSNTQKAADDLEFEGKKSFRYAINTKSKGKEKHEENDENGKENKKPEEPRVLTNEISSKHSKCCGIRGKRGRHGPKGEKGDRGEKGDEGRDGRDGPPGSPGRDGIPGKDGTKGDKGNNGVPGPKGSKGDRGPAGQEQYAESAHFIGKGGAIKPTLLNRKVITSWTVDHKSDSMSYSNGYLTIGVDGYYYIYSQVFYYANTSINGHSMFINDRRVLKAVQSIVNGSMIYHTKYIGGVFKIAKGQKVSVRTHISGKPFYFEKPSSYFGAFLIRKV